MNGWAFWAEMYAAMAQWAMFWVKVIGGAGIAALAAVFIGLALARR